jgi:hypothetical protein
VALLRLDRESRNRTRVEAPERDGIAGFDAIAVRTLLDAGESSLDLGDQFPLPVTSAQLDRAVGFRRCAVGEVGVVFAFLLQGGQRVAALGQNRFAPGDQLAAEIFALSVVHERFVVRRLITLNGHVVHGRSYFRVEFRGLIAIDRQRNNDYPRQPRRDQPAGIRGRFGGARSICRKRLARQ